MPTVTTNTAANSALRFLNSNAENSSSSISKLASGSRIVKASDDAAGLAIGTRLKADVAVLRQAAINATQGVSVLQVADGGLARISDVLQRMKALAAASLSGVPSNTERTFIDAEFQQLVSEITGIASSTRFNNEALLDGTGTIASGIDFFVGVEASDVVGITSTNWVSVGTALAVAGSFAAGSLGGATTLDTLSVDTVANATAAIDAVDTAIDQISEARANVGALISRFEFRSEQVATSIENMEAAKSTIMDVDLAEEQSKLVASQVLVQSSVSALAQANQLPQALLRLLQ